MDNNLQRFLWDILFNFGLKAWLKHWSVSQILGSNKVALPNFLHKMWQIRKIASANYVLIIIMATKHNDFSFNF